jgi:hypothetical protein
MKNFETAKRFQDSSISGMQTITPEIASSWLIKNKNNRPLSSYWVDTLSTAMQKGEWKYNAEAIKFDENGCLLDGQHRLSAVVKSGVTIQALVVYGLEPEVFITLDQGRKRTTRDDLALNGIHNTSNIAAALRFVAAEDAGSMGKVKAKLSRTEALRIFEKHPKLELSASYAAGKDKAFRKLISGAIGTYCHYKFSSINPHEANQFFESLANGADLAADSPILQLRNYLIRNQISHSDDARIFGVGIIIKAWNLWRKNKPCQVLRFNEKEPFPKPI